MRFPDLDRDVMLLAVGLNPVGGQRPRQRFFSVKREKGIAIILFQQQLSMSCNSQ
jgi:hypothetical protein